MAVIIHPHAAERMQERGATKEEVLETIDKGQVSAARFGRCRYEQDFLFKALWQSRYYEHKRLEVYAVNEGCDIIIVTVVVRYF